MTNDELIQLKAHATELSSDGGNWTTYIGSKDLLTLIAKVESLAADAERYRHMRNDPWPGACREFGVVKPDGDCWVDGKELDELIDAAMAKEKA